MTLEEARKIVGDKWHGPGHRGNVEDWLLCVSVLQELETLGYHKIWHVYELFGKVNDVRLVPLVLEKLGKFKDLDTEYYLAQGLAKPIYKAAVPSLIARYKSVDLPLTEQNLYLGKSVRSQHDFRFGIGYVLMQIKCKDYIDDYLELITNNDYVLGCSCIIELLCKLKENRAIEPMLRLLNDNIEKWSVLRHIGWYKDPELIKYVEPFLKDSNGEIRQTAKKAIERLNK
jgi:hypothetical protein